MRLWTGALAIVVIAGVATATVGRVGRDAAPALDDLPDWAGGRSDVAACERYLGKGLAAPSSYRRASATRFDSGVLDQATFDREAGVVPKSDAGPKRRSRDNLDATLASLDRIEAMQAQLGRDRAVGHQLQLRTVQITYDADNALGVPVRGEEICMFRLIDGAPEDPAQLIRRADRAGDTSLNAALRYLGREQRGEQNSATRCCL